MAYTHDVRDLTPAMTSNSAPSPLTASESSYNGGGYAYTALDHSGTTAWMSGVAPSIGSPQWMKIDFGSGNEQYVGAYALMDINATWANSSPRDWTFEGSNDNANWTVLDTRSGEVTANWSATLRYFSCSKSGLFRYYRINITANGGNTSYVCIMELELFDTRANLYQTMTSNTAPAPYACFASSEYSASYAAWKAFDKDLSTLWSPTSSNSGQLSYYFGGDKYIFSSISIYCNNFIKNYPNSFKIQGSNDNVTWEDLASYSDISNWCLGLWKNFSCKCTKSYRFIRLNILSLQATGDYCNIGELKVFGQLKDKCLTPVMTSNSLPSPYIVSQSSYYDTTTYGYNLFNRLYGASDTCWATYNGTVTGWVKIYLGGNLCKVSHIDIRQRNTANTSSIRDFTIQGSIDDVTYTTIGTFTGITWTNRETKIFPVARGYWKYIKIDITANNGGGYTSIGQIYIYGEQFSNLCATMTSSTTPSPYIATASSTENESTRGAWKAFNKTMSGDGDGWAANASTSGWLRYYFGGISYIFKSIVIRGWVGYTTNSVKDFIAQGSNDGTNFTNIKAFSTTTPWVETNHRYFELNSSVPYRYIQLNILSNGGSSTVVCGELEVYGTPAQIPMNSTYNITSDTVLFLEGKGNNGSTTIVDSATGKTVTANGNACISTSQYKFNNSSLYFDGSGDYLSIPTSTDFDFGTGNFTIDLYTYTVDANSYPTLISSQVSWTTGNICIRFDDNVNSAANKFCFHAHPTANLLVSSNTFTHGVWRHVAIVRDSSTTLKMYIEGNLEASATISSSLTFTFGSGIYVGIMGGLDASGSFSGYISHIRFIKGRALWTSPFIPPMLDIYDTRNILTKYNPIKDITPVMTGTSVPENYSVGAYTYTSGFIPYMIFDHTTGDTARWKATTYSGTVEAIAISYPKSFAVNRVDMTAPITDYLGMPRDFYIAGQSDSGSHVRLAEYTGVMWSSGETKTFRFNNDTYYSNIAIFMTAANSTSVLYTVSEVYMSREERNNYL